MTSILSYDRPATDWLNGLPIGTGRLAAMILGGVKRERVALNHEWLWRGRNRTRDNQPRHQHLAEVRRLLLAGDYEAGTKLANQAFGGEGGRSGRPPRVDAYQPAGDLYYEVSHPYQHDYRRELDLDTGLATVTYHTYPYRSMLMPLRQQYLAHLTEDLILVRLSADGRNLGRTPEKPVCLDVDLWLDRIIDPACTLESTCTPDHMLLRGAFAGGLDFAISARIWHNGEALVDARQRLAVRGASEILVAIDIGTGAHPDGAMGELARRSLSTHDWNDLLHRHVTEHRRHYGSFSFSLGSGTTGAAGPELAKLTTDERLRRLRSGTPDPDLLRLYLDYGRHLLVASSATAELPANLQGKWNEDIEPPWQCDYHFDINVQMNYWMTEPVGMGAYAEALLRFIERFVPHAQKAAQDLYGCRGVVFPIQTDCWGRSTPESYGWAVYVGAAPWLAQHLWWRWEYSQDQTFLRERCYPFLREVARFFADYGISASDGTTLLVPSQSPENRFVGCTSLPVSLCANATHDVVLVREAWTHAIQASELLELDPDERSRWRTLRDRLPPLRIGSDGRLLEWDREVTEAEPGHRHLSHLVALHPGDEIDAERTPELFAAALKSLETRLASFGGQTGWSRAWVACFCARAGKGDQAYEHLLHLLTDFSSDTLLDLHPPRIFCIDGNLGAVAVLTEMLLQSQGGVLRLLPARPSAWPEGQVRGLCARGGYRLDLDWAGGRLLRATVTASVDGTCVLARIPVGAVATCGGKPVATVGEDHRLTLNLSAGMTAEIDCA